MLPPQSVEWEIPYSESCDLSLRPGMHETAYSLLSFGESVSHLAPPHVLTKNKATKPRFRPQTTEMFQRTVKPSNQFLTAFVYNIVGWSTPRYYTKR